MPTSESSGRDTDPSYAFHMHALDHAVRCQALLCRWSVVWGTIRWSDDRSSPPTLLMLGTTRRTIVACPQENSRSPGWSTSPSLTATSPTRTPLPGASWITSPVSPHRHRLGRSTCRDEASRNRGAGRRCRGLMPTQAGCWTNEWAHARCDSARRCRVPDRHFGHAPNRLGGPRLWGRSVVPGGQTLRRKFSAAPSVPARDYRSGLTSPAGRSEVPRAWLRTYR